MSNWTRLKMGITFLAFLLTTPVALLLLAPRVARADFSLSPTSLTFTQRQTGPPTYTQQIAVNGTGTYSVGGLSCTGVFQALEFSSDGTPTGVSGGNSATGTAGVNPIYVNATGNDSLWGAAAGTYPCTFVVTGTGGATCTGRCTVSVSLVVVARTAATYNAPTQTGCTNTGASWFGLNNCPPPVGFKAGNYSPPAVGSSVTDPVFGRSVKTITSGNPRVSNCDAVTSCSNRDGSLDITIDLATTISYITDNNGVDQYKSQPNANAGQCSWDKRGGHEHTYYCLDPNGFSRLSIIKVDLVWPPPFTPCDTNVTCWSTTTVWTDPAATGATSIANGGDGDISSDNWWAVSESGGSPNQAFLINLSTGQAYAGSYPAYWTAHSFGPRSAFTWPIVQASTGKRWMAVLPTAASTPAFYSLASGGTSLVFEGYMPQLPQANQPNDNRWDGPHCTDTRAYVDQVCGTVGHSTFAYGNGHIGIVQPFDFDSTRMWVFEDLEQGVDNMLRSVEAGGGLYVIDGLQFQGQLQDQHFGAAANAPVAAVMSGSTIPPNMITVQVIGATNTNPITITTNPAYSGANGDRVCLNRVLGNTAANGCFVISNLVGATFTIPVAGNGTYTANTGGAVNNVAPDFSAFAHATETDIVDLSQIPSKSFKIYRVLQTLSLPLSGWQGFNLPNAQYYGQGHFALCPDGTCIWQDSNYMVPDKTQIYYVRTGFSATTNPGRPSGVKVGVAGGGVIK